MLIKLLDKDKLAANWLNCSLDCKPINLPEEKNESLQFRSSKNCFRLIFLLFTRRVISFSGWSFEYNVSGDILESMIHLVCLACLISLELEIESQSCWLFANLWLFRAPL